MNRWRIYWKTLLALALVMGAGGLAHPGRALADVGNVPITNVVPQPNSADVYDGSTGTYLRQDQPWLSVSEGTSQGPVAWLKVYVPINKAANVTIQAGGGWCWTDPFDQLGQDEAQPQVSYSLEDLDGNENSIAGGGTYFQTMTNQAGNNSTCRDLTFPTIPAGAGVPSSIYGHSNYRVFFFTARMTNAFCNPNTCTIVKSFRLSVDTGLAGFSRTVTQATNNNANHPFGVAGLTFGNVSQTGPLPTRANTPNIDWTFDFMFAPRCDENNPTSTLSVFDADNADPNFAPQNLSADLQWDSRDTPGFNWNNGPHWTANQLGAPLVNNSEGDLTFATTSHDRYKFYLRQFIWHNIIQFYVPLDQFDASLDSSGVTCFTSTCTIDPTAAIANVGQSIRIRVRETNAGAAPWDGNMGLGQVDPLSGQEYSFDSSTPPPIQPGQTALFDFNITRGSPITQKISYQMLDTGGYFFGATCSINIQFLGIPIPYLTTGCKDVTGIVSDYSNLTTVPTRLSFTDPNNPAAPAINYDQNIQNPPGTFDFDPFAKIPQLRPHIPYNVQLYVQTSVRNNNWTAAGRPQAMPQCLTIACTQNIPDFQPGETKQVTYGMQLTNKTSQIYPNGTYAVKVSVNPGVVMVGSPNPSTINGKVAPSAPDNNFSQQFNVTANYQGSIQASIFFGGNGIDTYYTNSPPPCSYTITPATKPYIKAFYGDVSTGGSFEEANGSCAASSSPEFVSPNAPGGDQYSGGIRTFSDVANGRGSSTDFAAFSQGLIEGAANDPLGHGFYSDSPNFSNYTGLNFSNKNTLGGLLGGSIPNITAHCATDFFDNEQTSGASYLSFPSIGAANLDNLTVDKQYFFKPLASQLNLSGLTIPAGRHVTVFVKGDVYITGNITYAPWQLSSSTDTVPYFSLIVDGNINVDPSVSQLDGFYVAQPTYDSATKQYNNGVLSTCSPGGSVPSGASAGTQIQQNCLGQITFNGAVLARWVRLMRSGGTINSAPPNGTRPDSQAAEVFNFSPEMIIGVPEFNPTNGGAVLPGILQGLFSLPPIF